ncbi:MAG: AbrB/MazE/SpoVT family DNA-binding domain-containing protein [Candidatus Anammoxibacter sp.]
MQTLKIDKNGSLNLPKDIRDVFKPSDKLAWFIEGDTLIIKRISPPKLSGIADRSKEESIPLNEIVTEVHDYRKEKSNK